ncbi:MAG: hypothetical protein JW895_05205 [Thermoleophilaceae bacterium]|nr:hypothetical protein [Thermoleophilaceae bacterium]
MPASPSGRPDRYEPLPGLLSLPGFLFRKLGPRGRVAALALGALAAVGLAAAAVVLVPRITETKRDNAAAEREERAAAIERERRRLIAEQRPHPGTGPAGDRAALTRSIEASVTRDARARVAAGDLSPPRALYSICRPLEGGGGRLSCTAVTSEVPGGEGVVGHPFRVLADYPAGRYRWCKVSGRAGEGSFTRLLNVPVPKACGG